jgi:hypothetical protein
LSALRRNSDNDVTYAKSAGSLCSRVDEREEFSDVRSLP